MLNSNLQSWQSFMDGKRWQIKIRVPKGEDGVDCSGNRQAIDMQSAIVNVYDKRGARTMMETQQTSTSNTYFDLVSILYHALREEQTCATYANDAQKAGDQDL